MSGATLTATFAGLLSGDSSDTVLTMTEVTSEEARVDSQVRDALGGQGQCSSPSGAHTLYHPDDLPFKEDLSDMSDGFTPFKKQGREQEQRA